MSHTLWVFGNELLGLDLSPSDLESRHMIWRAFVVFTFYVVLIRVADRRLLGHNAGFDIIVAVVLGAVLSRAINGHAAFFPTLGASALIVALHHSLAAFAFRFHAISQLVKGRTYVLVRDGKLQHAELQRCHITLDDLDENLRLSGNVGSTSQVAEARLERNGSISVLRTRNKSPAK